jgi:hypothetical protein
MKHSEIRWNPEFQEWFCVSCGRTSDHVVYEDAQAELALFECELPAASDVSLPNILCSPWGMSLP